jgi:nicotinate-nucleotide pyrophosphorylase (carboxylating)
LAKLQLHKGGWTVNVEFPSIDVVLGIVRNALNEDIGSGDVTSASFIPADARAEAHFVAKENLILCGLPVAELVFRELDHDSGLLASARDGDRVKKGAAFASITGNARAVLAAERTALNFLQRMSGIATLTGRYVEQVRPTAALIYDTRKTVPGLRILEKYAVRVGGGRNHRMGLYDQILLKDNHMAVLNGLGFEVFQMVEALDRDSAPRVEIEVTSVDDAVRALEAGADIVMLDNMTLEEMRKAVHEVSRRAAEAGVPVPALEASGGVTLERVADIAAAGVHRISIGELTHSVRAVDISLEVV